MEETAAALIIIVPGGCFYFTYFVLVSIVSKISILRRYHVIPLDTSIFIVLSSHNGPAGRLS
jgi:hypothetical protein